MPTITPSTIYWITRLDSIRSQLNSMIMITLFAVAMTLIAFVIWATEADGIKYVPDGFKRVVCRYVPLALICCFILDAVNTFIPTTKETAAIYMIPAVANSTKVQSIASESLDSVSSLIKLSNTWVQEQLAAPKASN